MSARAIYIDVHGVLLDFVAGCERNWNTKVPDGPGKIEEKIGVTSEEFFDSCSRAGFWYCLPALPAAHRLLETVRQMACSLHCPVYACTRVLRPWWAASEGTVERLIQDFGFEFDQIIACHDKAACAPGFLIDDEAANCTDFRRAGGEAFLWPARINHYGGQFVDPSLTQWGFVADHLVRDLVVWHKNVRNPLRPFVS